MPKALSSFTLARTFRATPTEVFVALTNSRALAAWSGEGSVSKKVGGLFTMFDGWVEGKVLVYKFSKELAYTWKTTEWPETWAPSEVHYTLRASKASTSLTLTHTNLPNRKEAKEHQTGWVEHVFEPLEEYLGKK